MPVCGAHGVAFEGTCPVCVEIGGLRARIARVEAVVATWRACAAACRRAIPGDVPRETGRGSLVHALSGAIVSGAATLLADKIDEFAADLERALGPTSTSVPPPAADLIP